MDCGADDTLCWALEWLAHNEFTAKTLLNWLANPSFGWVSVFLDQHGEKLIGLAGFSFGLYRWWKYREAILHKRLFEYLKESDTRLVHSQSHILDALDRPGPGKKILLPLFANKRLRRILKRQRWDSAVFATNVESSTQSLITGAVLSIERQLSTAEDSISLLRKQLATAHIISGSLASARAGATETKDIHLQALRAFRTALQIPGYESNVVAKELEAHQLRKLGMQQEAKDAYAEIERSTSGSVDYRTLRLVIARAKRYQAEYYQIKNSTVHADGSRTFTGSTTAAGLLYPARSNSALAIRSNFTPYLGWELIEQGDTHFVTAFVAKHNNDTVIERSQLAASENAYEAVRKDALKRRLWPSSSVRRLRAQAERGLRLIEEARKGIYDYSWLCQP